MNELYGVLKPDGTYLMTSYGENLYATTDKKYAKFIADGRGFELVRIEVNHFFITPRRKATIARNEEKQMAAKPKAKKPASKAPVKKGKC